MSAKVKLSVTRGSKKGEAFVFEQTDSLVLGRKDDCSIVLPEKTVSRYHCIIDINPPNVMVRDFGSLNGTFLNGEKVGQRDAGMTPEEGKALQQSSFELNNGDTLGLGRDCAVACSITQPIYCKDCGCEIDEAQDEKHAVESGEYICKTCHALRQKEAAEQKAREEAERKKRAEEEAAKKLAEQKAAELARKEKAAKERIAKEKAEKERKEAEKKAADLAAKQRAERERRAKQEAQRKAAARRAAQQRLQRNQKKCEICGKPVQVIGAGLCSDCLRDPIKALEKMILDAMKAQPASLKGKPGVEIIPGYREIKKLGRGGMGQVCLVEDVKTKQKLALKTMVPQAANNQRNRDLFMREANINQQLHHQNVVKVHQSDYAKGMYFILMEYCEGGSLDNFIRRHGGKLDFDLATNIMMQILDGLIYTHSAEVTADKKGKLIKVNGVVHRDFKPGNVFLSDNSKCPVVKIADFGLAKAFEIAGHSGFTKDNSQAMGSPEFAPRQQVLNFKEATPAIDVWAAASTYYFMLTGKFAKEFPGNMDRWHCALLHNAVPIRKRNPKISARLAKVIDAALVDDPDIDVQSAAQLKRMIEGAL